MHLSINTISSFVLDGCQITDIVTDRYFRSWLFKIESNNRFDLLMLNLHFSIFYLIIILLII